MWFMEINEIIGKNLAELRKEKGLTQREVAVKLDFSDKSVSKWESGESMPSVDVLYKLGELYGVKLDYFVTETHTAEQIKEPEQPLTAAPAVSRHRYSRLIISLLSILVIWIAAVCLFIFTQEIIPNTWIFFVWAVPASIILSIIFASLWGKPIHLFILISILIWTGLIAIFLQLVLLNNIFWQIFILGAPLQIATILCAFLVLKNKSHDPATIRARREYKKELALKKREKQKQKAEQQKLDRKNKKETRQQQKELAKLEKTTKQEEKTKETDLKQTVETKKEEQPKKEETVIQKTKNENIIQNLH